MRRIYFVKYYDKGSTHMGADQISAGLRARGIDARAVYPRDLASVRESILVYIKTSKIHDLVAARLRGNKNVLDVQDTVVFKRGIKNRWLFDGLIFKNRRQLLDFSTPKHLSRVIYHQWDERYSPNQAGEGGLRAAYFGEPRSFPFWNALPGVDFYATDWFANAPRYNCHVSYRQPGREFLYKPNCKVSTAAACHANLVTTADESTVEFLGADYPFYGDGTEAGLRMALVKAREGFLGPEWKLGLERMREVKEKTRLDRVLDDYLRFFADLG